MRGAGPWLLVGLALAACEKVPVFDIFAQFTISDAAWFEEEQTLFVFYSVEAEQGLGPDSVIELTYRTDTTLQDWTDVGPLPRVHTHLPVDCGEKARCGSLSLHVPLVPREVGIRLRYHREGEVVLGSTTNFNVIATGPAHSHRSLLVYGVFDGSNTQVQWRARHQFPTLRNEEVQRLGLRRTFSVDRRAHGALSVGLEGNPYGYGVTGSDCPATMTPLPPVRVETQNRAIFEPLALPLETSPSPVVCGVSTVSHATGTFQTVALARKNPEVRDAFPLLRSPVTENVQLAFLLAPCNREISPGHEALQRQRLLLEGAEEICLDDWQSPTFPNALATVLQQRIDTVRAQGRDMVLKLAVHHDVQNGQLSLAVERALGIVLPPERDKSSPRVSGAFVFDSFGRAVSDPEVNALALWCPARFAVDDLDAIPEAEASICAIQPAFPDLALGPVRFNTLPILPTRAQYQTFVDKYGEGQAGRMLELKFLAPERTPLSENVPIGPFGTVTFFNNESFSAAPTDAFSFCERMNADGQVTTPPFFFRADPSMEPLPVSALPELHSQLPFPSYQLGLFWQFPFLTLLKYETFAAGAATAYDFTVPFGLAIPGSGAAGAGLWLQGEFQLAGVLDHCTRFCDHPTFDPGIPEGGGPKSISGAGVYNVLAPFREAYRALCYGPTYPDPAREIEEVFPRDP